MPLRILTWNINGIRAVKGKSTKELLNSLQADIICLQETKVTRDMLDEPTAIVEGYDSYFSFSRKRTGYSGTVNYCRITASPHKAEEGLTGRLSQAYTDCVKCYGNMDDYASDLDALDAEGRCIITQHQIRLPDAGVKDVAVMNVYVPRFGDKEDRLKYKLQFLQILQSRAETLLEHNIHVIILGDLNLTHTKLDNCDPQSDDDFKLKSSRIWMNEMLQNSERDFSLPKTDFNLATVALPNLKGGMFSDIYRRLHVDQENAFTNWNTSTDARRTNYGRRLDYILIDTKLAQYATECSILTDVDGSDHCPVAVTLNCEPVPSKSCPLLCSKYMPEFKGQQQKLSSFFLKSVKQKEKLCSPPELFVSDTEDLQGINGFPVKQSTRDFNSSKTAHPALKHNGVANAQLTRKPQVKRSVTTAVNKNNKRIKVKQDTVTKQVSLTSFFTNVRMSKETVQGSETCEINGNSQRKCTEGAETLDRQDDDILLSEDSTETDSSCFSQSGDSISPVSQEIVQSHSGTSETNSSNAASVKKSVNATSAFTDSLPSSPKDTCQVWKSLLTGPPPPPLCPGHKEPCILKTVNKKGPNKNKKFYVCARPEGVKGNPEYRCNFFLWYQQQK